MTPTEIKALRLKLGVSQRGLAALIGYAQNTVAQWECGARKPSAHAVRIMRQIEREKEGK